MVPSQELKSQFSHGFAILQLKHRKDTKKSEKQADFENFSDKSRDFFPYYQKKTYFCAIKLIIWTALPRIARDSSQ